MLHYLLLPPTIIKFLAAYHNLKTSLRTLKKKRLHKLGLARRSKVGKLSSNLKIIASYFMELVTSLKVCPRNVRTDCGTENVLLAAMQCFLRLNNTDQLSGLRRHCYGASQRNKKIEA